MAKMQNAAHTNIEEEEEEEKWVKHYSSLHEILLVGEGDFSFSTCLAKSFGSASNIVATSLDSYDDVIKKYKRAKSNFSILDKLGALRLHGVDAKEMKFHTYLRMRKFDRIIFNFPHAGFHRKDERDINLISMHKDLLYGFFKNASGMLRTNGEIHVNHKTKNPYSRWNLKELACQNSLGLIERVNFKKEDYPGYENKRGSGKRCDDFFHLGECCTFKFRFSRNAKRTKGKKNAKRLPNLAKAPVSVPRQPNRLVTRLPLSYHVTFVNDIPGGSTCELRQAPRRATLDRKYFEHRQCRKRQAPAPAPTDQQRNYHGHRQRRKRQAPSCAYPQGHYPNQRERRELHPATSCAYQEGNFFPSEPPSSHFTQQMRNFPNSMVSPHTDGVYIMCSRIFGVYFERVVEALRSSEHNQSFGVGEAFNFFYEIFKAADPQRTWREFMNILDQLRSLFFRRGVWQVRRQQNVGYDLADNGERGTFIM